MNRWLLICCCLLFVSPAIAATNVTSELSHATGGALIAGAVTAVADNYWPEHRGIIGFSVSTAGVLVGEGLQMAEGEAFSSSLQDVVAHTIGALVGATITDRCFLAPVVDRDHAGSVRIGIVMQQNF
ncbi:MAG: hypothetical protein PHR66_09970 [Desulfuromonadaceae bacterium]|nr:hypothetical protein [Desulfuromonadaceae bacterium]